MRHLAPADTLHHAPAFTTRARSTYETQDARILLDNARRPGDRRAVSSDADSDAGWPRARGRPGRRTPGRPGTRRRCSSAVEPASHAGSGTPRDHLLRSDRTGPDVRVAHGAEDGR